MSCVDSSSPPEAADWVQNGGFLLIMVGVGVMFWGMTFICEEYCVPAITVFCKRNNFSDDVAGSIFIGTGLSLPVLFASFVGLFVENSSIGVGTVVGGNIFNQLVNICVGIHAAPDQTMKIDKVVFMRENLFYILSCVLVMWAAENDLRNAFEQAFSREQWEKCLSIRMGASLVLVGNYVFYCIVEIYFQTVYDAGIAMFRRWKLQLIPGSEMAFSGSLQDHDGRVSPPLEDNANAQHTLCDEEAVNALSTVGEVRRRNFSNADGSRPLVSPIIRGQDNLNVLQEYHTDENTPIVDDEYNPELAGIDLRFIRNDHIADGGAGHVVSLPGLSESIQEVQEQQPARVDHLLEEFPMFMRSSFYETHGIGCVPSSRKWNLRYFTFNQHGLYYKLDFHLPMRGNHLRFIDVFDLEQVSVNNANLLEFSLTLRSSRKIYFFRATETVVYDSVLRKLQTFLEEIKIRNDSELRAMSMKAVYEMLGTEDSVDPDSESVEDTMFIVPTDTVRKVFYYLTLPLKVLIFITTPDVRRPGSEHKAIWSTMMGFAWLAGITYVLIAGLNEMANLLSISGAVLGITVGAWAASYPAAWSTVVVARYGYGDMVVCNALGSNVFSNYLGLGLPWLVYTLVYQKPYSAIQDQGVVLSQLTLIFVALLVFAMIAWNRWVLQAWMIPVMMAVYFGYVAYFVYFMITL